MDGLPQLQNADVLQHLGDSLRAQWRRHRKRLKDCQKHFSKRAVHDSRVATRRLLSTIELLQTFLPEYELRKARQALKQYFDIFGPLRDTQVQLALVARLAKRQPAAQTFYKWLRKRETRLTRETCEATRGIKTKHLARHIAALEKEIQACRKHTSRLDAFDLVLHSLALKFARTVRLQIKANPEKTKTIHRTRIAFKHFRYMIEALLPLLPSVTDKHRQAMRRFQTLAGDIQDAEVLLATFEKFAKRNKIKESATNRLRKELLRRQERAVRTYMNAADRLLETCPGADLPAPAPR